VLTPFEGGRPEQRLEPNGSRSSTAKPSLTEHPARLDSPGTAYTVTRRDSVTASG
jgi:hypothetical protein